MFVALIVATFVTCVVMWPFVCPKSGIDNHGIHLHGCAPAILAVITSVPVGLLFLIFMACLGGCLVHKLVECCEPRRFEVV